MLNKKFLGLLVLVLALSSPIKNTWAGTGCFVTDGCKDGYTFQNGKCISTSGVCEYTSQSACENANPGFKCKEEGTSSSGNSDSHSGGS